MTTMQPTTKPAKRLYSLEVRDLTTGANGRQLMHGYTPEHARRICALTYEVVSVQLWSETAEGLAFAQQLRAEGGLL